MTQKSYIRKMLELYESAKYKMLKNFVSSLIPFYTIIAFKSYIPPTFSETKFFYILYNKIQMTNKNVMYNILG